MTEAAHPSAPGHEEESHGSPWPILLGIGSAVGLAGLVFGWPVLLAGVVVFGYGMARWLRDDLWDRFHGPRVEVGAEPFPHVEARKLGMWIFIASEVLLFAALIGTYLMFRVGHPEIPTAADRKALDAWVGASETYVLLTSSLSLVLALHLARENRRRAALAALAATLALGLAFLTIKGFDWSHIIPGGFAPWSGLMATMFFTTTGVHGAHVLGGCLGISYLIYKVHRGGLLGEKSKTIEHFGIYWHFVDIVWVFLFPLFYLA